MNDKKDFNFVNLIKDTKIQIIILVLLLLLFVITREPLIGILTLITLISFIIIESFFGIKKHGVKKEIKETIIAVLVAIGLWFLLSIVLNTSSPISAVVSCSMADQIQRGDLIFVKGESEYTVPTVSASNSQVAMLTNDPIIEYGDTKLQIKGSLYSLCQSNANDLCKEFVTNPEKFKEIRGDFIFNYDMCTRNDLKHNIKFKEPCLKSINFKNQTITFDKDSDIIVYVPNQNDLFYLILQGGDVIHRAILKINTHNDTYYLTKGDNNNIADVQFYSYTLNMGNSPIPESQLKGKLILKVPILGYYKLFLIGSFQEDVSCQRVLQ